ncbi:MAG: c-type cytochrome [Bacteroidetes bacterium]|nr:c-type cytochrome [Bacteroidota bacterium]
MFKTIGIISIIITGILIAGASPFYADHSSQKKTNSWELKVQKNVLEQIKAFQNFVKDSFYVEAGKSIRDEKKLQQHFLKSRLLFKKFEWAAAYFAANLTDRINGPPVQEIENADLLDPSLAYAIDPMGLQVIEELIYPNMDSASKKKLPQKIGHLITNTEYLISFFTTHPLASWRILDAAKLEVFRIISLGITGFDNPLSLNSMHESATALSSLKNILEWYAGGKNGKSLLQDIDASIAYLQAHPDFSTFNRTDFIIHFANKISTGIAQLEQKLPGEKIRYNRMLNQDIQTMFDSGAFNVNAFAPGPEFHLTNAKAALGEKLFYDVSLSGTGTRSCASCHKPELAFSDGLAKNTELHNPQKLLPRNVPTLLNAALQSNYFYDMRALTLESQAADVISDKREMDGSMEAIIKYVSANKAYQSMFAKAFSKNKENKISADEVTNALASYIRSLVLLNSRFDEYMRGNENAMSPQEVRGLNLFMGKAKCATCHFIPLFNGVTPPKYAGSETDVIGVPVSPTDSTLDQDEGYYGIIKIDSYKHAFKTPTLRNVSKTAPYMHNGAYPTLEKVMEFYNNGGAAGLKINLPNQSLSKKNLNLTQAEIQDIIAFMKSLDSK